MNAADIPVYRELADLYQQQGQSQLRDRFLVLAAQAAQESGDAAQAERFRQRLLQHNPHHMVKPFASFAEALRSPDVQNYVRDLKQSYPLATAHQMLAGLRQSALRQPQSPPQPQPQAEPAPYRMLPPATVPRAPMGAAATRPGTVPQRALRPTAMLPHPDEPPHGPWLATALFILMFLLGAALGGYALLRPFFE
jgi:hypothetical protein